MAQKSRSEKSIVVRESKSDLKANQKKSLILTSCRPARIVDLVEALNEKQKSDVISIGFGGLLDVSFRTCNLEMLTWLVKRFNGGSRMLSVDRYRNFVLTADDVYDIFMLPRGGSSVSRFGKQEEHDLLVRLGKIYDIHSRTPEKVVFDLLTDQLVFGGDDFKRLFVLYVMSTFLTPSSNRLLKTGILKSVVDVNNICKLNWCEYVLNWLCDAVMKFDGKDVKNVSGCVIILQIAYFHRVKWQGVAESCELPLIKHWSIEKMEKRCKEEAAAGRYGDGEIVVNVYPVSGKEGYRKEKPAEEENVDVEENVAGNTHDDGEKTGRFIMFSLPDGELDDSEIKKISKDDIHETLLCFRRDISIVSDHYMKKLLSMKKKISEKVSSSPEISESQKFFSDEKLHNYIDSVVENFLSMNKIASDMPSFNIFTPEDIAVNEVVEDVWGEAGATGEELRDAVLSVGSKERKAEEKGNEGFWGTSYDVGYVSDFMVFSNKFLNDMDVRDKEIVDYCLFVEDSEESQGDDEERLFQNGYFNFITKNDMLSLYPKCVIYQSVLTTWFLMVNADEEKTERRSRFVFNLELSLCLEKIINSEGDEKENRIQMRSSWETWMASNKNTLNSVDMIFIPFCLECHYAAVAVNFIDKKIQYLDNRKYGSENNFFKCAEILKTEMSIFLRSKKHKKARQILDYEFENVLFKWQTTNKDVDCGVYLMHHVDNFDGVPYEIPDLTKAVVRRVLRAKVCVSLVLSKLNEIKSEVLQKVSTFYQKKPDLKAKIMEEKKKANYSKKKTKVVLPTGRQKRRRND